ncbi:hypothetical protein [Vibrio rotiferianus]|uniref:hypothetical protein n=1 Tax=Vibrio rotiferianus TaxID=190895 RepID=UPI000B5A0A04|nr:hypothetical protein [Vibrio rotiferianus]ASI97586.1 hypothetical protein BSZ04_22175 [Vibrio rotiferianus]
MNLWKKTLLATAVAAISTGAMAAETTATATKISAEGLVAQSVANDGTVYKIADTMGIKSNVNWSKDDTVTITLDGATFAAGQTYSLTAPSNEATFTLMSANENEVVFRVAQVQTSGETVNTVFNLAITKATVASGYVILDEGTALNSKVTATSVVRTSAGEVIDSTAKDTATVAEVVSQFKLEPVTLASTQTIFKTVAPNTITPKAFQSIDSDVTAAGANDEQLALNATYADDKANVLGEFVVDKETVIVKGPLAAFDGATGNGTATPAAGTKVVNTATKVAFTESVSTNATGNGNVVTLASVAAANVTDDTAQISAGKFTVSYELTDLAGKTVTLNAQETAGVITLDTPATNIPYLPVGDAVAPFVWVTNATSATYDIYAVATTVNGSQYDLGVVGAAKPGQTKVDVAIVDALKDAGVNTQYETLNLKLYINGATGFDGTTGGDAVTVYAAYKHIGDSDRLQVPVITSDEFTKDIDY